MWLLVTKRVCEWCGHQMTKSEAVKIDTWYQGYLHMKGYVHENVCNEAFLQFIADSMKDLV